MQIDTKELTDDDIHELLIELREEKRRRSEEEKRPVFYCDNMYRKSLGAALNELIEEAQRALNFKGGPEAYFAGAISRAEKTSLLTLDVEFWSKSEYDARPDVVWG
ncbi:hypothetical protein PVT67_15655 [Gallaecimonas kandeliae]|uniref:hypothetical protein n=1 Tax=Gallaecimonas kandeliae TaxID=3029055 RepID=UPI002647F12D|nr:hypothetical protein [Gallaecimonas kandeliae]WKE65078.1 hypothetical protein PVT67_15655 [Gallaecimonas kandeliae]